jgi:hypothetical protein
VADAGTGLICATCACEANISDGKLILWAAEERARANPPPKVTPATD